MLRPRSERAWVRIPPLSSIVSHHALSMQRREVQAIVLGCFPPFGVLYLVPQILALKLKQYSATAIYEFQTAMIPAALYMPQPYTFSCERSAIRVALQLDLPVRLSRNTTFRFPWKAPPLLDYLVPALCCTQSRSRIICATLARCADVSIMTPTTSCPNHWTLQT